MATGGTNKSKARSTTKSAGGEKSAFFGGNKGALVGAAVAGAAFGLAITKGRKLIMQSPAFVSGTWQEALKTEHRMTLALFDQLEATADEATTARTALVAKIKYALSKHALQEENAVYPALREANDAADADELNSEHGYVKTYLYELTNMAKDAPEFLAKVRDFRSLLEDHIREEEERIFPRLYETLTEEQNRKLTLMMNREGLKLA
jgi:hemerythrin superfamily protein